MRKIILPAIAASALALGGCASNYGGEGALAGGVIGAIAGGTEGAAIGAAAGAVGGSLIEKKGDTCYYRDRDGRRYTERC